MLAIPASLRTSPSGFRIFLGTTYRKHLLAQPGWPHLRTNTHQIRRQFALSRFPDRRTGFGRASAASRRLQREPGSSNSYEDLSSVNSESEPWSSAVPLRSPGDSEVALTQLLANGTLVITRQLEMLNIFVGFEQSNRYVITNISGEALGYVVEEPRGLLSMFSRQLFRTHRPLRALVMDLNGSPILWIRRPFAWISSRMFVQRPLDSQSPGLHDKQVLDTFAEVQQEWHLWRRKYNLFLRTAPIRVLTPISEPEPEDSSEPHFEQFARIDEGLWAWKFTARNADGDGIATISRAFRGFGREIFTDTGQYVVTFSGEEEPVLPTPGESLQLPRRPQAKDLTCDQRALILATAVNIDYDYFSRHSEGHWFGAPENLGSSGIIH